MSSSSEIGSKLIESFPDLRETIEDSDGSIYYEFTVLANHAQRAKGRGDWPTYERCVSLADSLLTGASAELRNAIAVSFVEHLSFGGTRGPQAWKLLPARLREIHPQTLADPYSGPRPDSNA